MQQLVQFVPFLKVVLFTSYSFPQYKHFILIYIDFLFLFLLSKVTYDYNFLYIHILFYLLILFCVLYYNTFNIFLSIKGVGIPTPLLYYKLLLDDFGLVTGFVSASSTIRSLASVSSSENDNPNIDVI